MDFDSEYCPESDNEGSLPCDVQLFLKEEPNKCMENKNSNLQLNYDSNATYTTGNLTSSEKTNYNKDLLLQNTNFSSLFIIQRNCRK